MSPCDEKNKNTAITLAIFAGTSVPIAAYMVADGGIAAIEPALISGLVVGGIASLGYLLYKADFNLGNLVGSTAGSAICGGAGLLDGLYGSIFGSL